MYIFVYKELETLSNMSTRVFLSPMWKYFKIRFMMPSYSFLKIPLDVRFLMQFLDSPPGQNYPWGNLSFPVVLLYLLQSNKYTESSWGPRWLRSCHYRGIEGCPWFPYLDVNWHWTKLVRELSKAIKSSVLPDLAFSFTQKCLCCEAKTCFVILNSVPVLKTKEPNDQTKEHRGSFWNSAQNTLRTKCNYKHFSLNGQVQFLQLTN